MPYNGGQLKQWRTIETMAGSSDYYSVDFNQYSPCVGLVNMSRENTMFHRIVDVS